jgi:hypothetical protein
LFTLKMAECFGMSTYIWWNPPRGACGSIVMLSKFWGCSTRTHVFSMIPVDSPKLNNFLTIEF